MFSRRRKYALNASDISLTTTYSKTNIATVPRGVMSSLFARVTTIASGATTVSWYLSDDAAGDQPITPVTTTTIVVGATTATKGGFGAALNVVWAPVSSNINDVASVYFVAKTNAGTATATKVWLVGEPE